MCFKEKKQAALSELKSSKIWQSNYQPPFLLFMWWLGKETKPPHYSSFINNALSLGSFFGLFWGVIMWLFVWNSTRLPVLEAMAASLLAGAYLVSQWRATIASVLREITCPSGKS
ncbi:MAG: DUF6404 family protein [Pseudomonadota bacterium]